MPTSVLFQEELKALAYLDPVSGGAILQILIGILLAVSLFVRAFWRKIKELYNRLTGKADLEQSGPTDSSAPGNE